MKQKIQTMQTIDSVNEMKNSCLQKSESILEEVSDIGQGIMDGQFEMGRDIAKINMSQQKLLSSGKYTFISKLKKMLMYISNTVFFCIKVNKEFSRFKSF